MPAFKGDFCYRFRTSVIWCHLHTTEERKRGISNLKVQIIDVNVQKQRAQQGPLREPSFDRFPVRVSAIQFDSLSTNLQVIAHQLQCLICEVLQAVGHGKNRNWLAVNGCLFAVHRW